MTTSGDRPSPVPTTSRRDAVRLTMLAATLGAAAACGGTDGAAGDDVTRTPDGAVVAPDGAVVAPDGAVVPPDAPAPPPPDGGPPAGLRPFIAPAQPRGNVVVHLHPTEGVATGRATLVTFGLPLPRGSLTAAQLATVRVLDAAGQEIPAFVESLTPWRHATNAALDGASVRVARIQFRYTFAVTYPRAEDVTVAWGDAARTRSLSALENPRTGWHAVTSGTFVTGDNVAEPDVYAVLPPAWLTQGVLRPGPMDPFDPAVTEARDDPAVMDATEHYPGYREQQFALKNFFYTSINADDPRVSAANLAPYRTDAEPWLYDRASTFYVLYFRSGFLRALREAVRAAVFYAGQLYPPGTTPDAAVGCFRLKNPSPSAYIGANGVMYSYNESLAYTFWLTGDPQMLEPIRWVSKAQEDATDEAFRWSPTAGYTERHVGFRGLAHTVAYEVLGAEPYRAGRATYRDLMVQYADNMIYHQDGGGGAVPAARVDGALWKLGRQQGDGPEDAWVASPWLSAITVDSMVRVYGATERTDVARFVRRMGTFLAAASDRGADEEYDSGEQLRRPDYVTLIDGSTYAPDGATGEHALEVSASVGWAYYFSLVLGARDGALRDTANDLYRTYDFGVNYWTRPTAPASGATAYRLSVGGFRKFNWEHRPSGSLSWCLSQ
jgi:hypothetical protein